MRPLPQIPTTPDKAGPSRRAATPAHAQPAITSARKGEAAPGLQGIFSPIERQDVLDLCPIHEKASRQAGEISGTRSEEKLTLATTLYPNLYDYLLSYAGSHSGNLSDISSSSPLRDLRSLLRDTPPSDIIGSLIRSYDHRIRLHEVASNLGVAEDDFREAECQDEAAIRGLFSKLVSCSRCKSQCASLQGEDAQKLLDLIHNFLLFKPETRDQSDDSPVTPADDPDSFKQALLRLSVRISKSSGKLPISMALDGVTLENREPIRWGGFADVYRGRYRDEVIALKRMRMYLSSRDKELKEFLREALLWRYLSHPHVLPFYGVDGRTFPEAIALVSPWMPNGNIIEYLNRQEPSSTLIENLLRQIIAGLVYLHDSVDVVHGDLRGPNILIDSDGRARLGDFGLALLAVETNTRNSFPSGTARYMAPELHAPEKFGLPHCRPTKPTDIYALAFLVLELYTLRPPFADMKDTAVALRVIDADRPARPTREDCRGVEIPEALWTTVQVCWEQDFSRRPTIAQLAAAGTRSWDLTEPAPPRLPAHLEVVAPLSPRRPPQGSSAIVLAQTRTPPLRKPTYEELRGKLLKIALPDGSRETTINVHQFTTGVQVLEAAVKKLGTLVQPRGGDGVIHADPVQSEGDGLTIDGWGIYWDKPGQSLYGAPPQGPLTDAQLLSICHTERDNPVREHGLTLRRSGKGWSDYHQDSSAAKDSSRSSPYRAHLGRRADSSADLLNSPGSSTPFSSSSFGRRAGARSMESLLSHRAADQDPKLSSGKSHHRRADTADAAQGANSVAASRNLASALPFSPLKSKTSMMSLAPRIMVRSPTMESDLDMRGESATPPSKAGRTYMHIDTALAQANATGTSKSTQRAAARTDDYSKRPVDTGQAPVEPETPRRGLPLTPLVIDDTVFPRPRNPPADPSSVKQLPSLPPPSSGGRSHDASPVTPELMRHSRPAMDDVYARLDAFFPKHNLDEPVIEPMAGGASPISEAPPRPVTPTTKFRQRKSIRVVAAERKRKLDGAFERKQSTSSSTKKAQRRTTKLWGSKVQEVAPVSSPTDRDELTTPLTSAKPVFKWIRGELIGKGTFGRVYLAMNATTGEVIAVKQVERPRTAADQDDSRQIAIMDALKLESDTLKDLHHPHIVEYLGFEETPDFLSIFLEYVPGGSIGSALRTYGRFPENTTKSFAGQVLSGLEYLHGQGIIHRDVKADNILVDQDGICKISDFGTSKRTHSDSPATALRGTLYWMAPEVVQVDGQRYTTKIDIWSVGCLVLEMWSGRRPWSDEQMYAALMKLGSKDSNSCPPVPSDVVLSTLAEDFRLKCFKIDPNERPPASELRKHPYLEIPADWTFPGFNKGTPS